MGIQKKTFLTIDDLIRFCEEKKYYSFNASEYGSKLKVQVPTVFEEETDVDEDHRGMMKLKIKIFHTGLNRNQSHVSEDAAKKAMPTIKNRPLLAAIHQLDNGEWDFESHNFEIITNDDGTEIRYIEQQIGSFAESEPFFEYDEELDKNFICSYGYVSEEYSKAASIIRNKKGTKNSVELAVEKFSYNAKEKYLDLEEFYVEGSTFLGRKKDGTEVKEGMLGSRADIADFCAPNNSILNALDANEKLVDVLDKLNNTLSNLNINRDQRKEETEVEDNIVVLEETVEVEENTEVAEVVDNTTEESTEEVVDTEEVEVAAEETPEVIEEVVETNSMEVNSQKYSVTMPNGVIKEFDLSLDEITWALHTLVNDTYGEADNAYYSVTVYEGGYIIMREWWDEKAYRQNYSREEDNFSLVGDRVEVFANWLTADEEQALKELRSNYSSIETELKKYHDAELEEQKVTLLNSNDYTSISDKLEFTNLIKNHSNFTLDELKSELDKILLSYAKSGSLNFNYSVDSNLRHQITLPVSKASKKGPYGSLKFN